MHRNTPASLGAEVIVGSNEGECLLCEGLGRKLAENPHVRLRSDDFVRQCLPRGGFDTADGHGRSLPLLLAARRAGPRHSPHTEPTELSLAGLIRKRPNAG